MTSTPQPRQEQAAAPRSSLLEFFDAYVQTARESFSYDDGFRTRSYTFLQTRHASEALAARLTSAGVQPGEKIVIWCENRPEWVVAFWACLLRGVVVVPVDCQASVDLLRRIVGVAQPRGIFVGDDVQASGLPPAMFVWRLSEIEWPDTRATTTSITTTAHERTLPPHAVGPETVAEIVFTSGTTADPKGVVITHGNILANIAPIEREVLKYRRWLRFAQPIRFLNLLPLSHMFGQALAMFLPPLVPAAVAFMRGHNPDRVLAQIRKRRIMLLIAVPRLLEMLRDRVRRLAPECEAPTPAGGSWIVRRLRSRAAHRPFGWKFCGFVVGAAQLDPDVEEFWHRSGFAVIQGYGLTETAPIVTWNHPFRTKTGTVGRPLEGVEVRVAPDGEILVRGPNVTRGYFGASDLTASAFTDGWFHTGDVGSFDDTGHLLIRGRKKDVIVTPEGLHVFPEDVERVVNAIPGVRESAVIGRHVDGAERVHVVLLLRAGTEASLVLRDANTRLETHQRIRDFSLWPGGALPRTATLRKLRRDEIRDWAEHVERPRAEELPARDELEQLLARYAGDRVTPEATLEELGLTSLDRIELMMALEERAGTPLDETAVAEARTVGEIRRAVDRSAETLPVLEPFAFPRWNRGWPARLARNVSQTTWLLPMARVFMRLQVQGLEHLGAIRGPVIFAANHQSHFDTPAILGALPSVWRRSVAVAMATEFFDVHFFPARHRLAERVSNSTLYVLAALLFNAFPLRRNEPGSGETLRYMGSLIDDGWSVLIFPEGHRTERGELMPFQAGVGMIASRLQVPVVPVRLHGVHRVLHHTSRRPRRGPVSVTFGPPLLLQGSDYTALARQVQAAVAALRPAADDHPRADSHAA